MTPSKSSLLKSHQRRSTREMRLGLGVCYCWPGENYKYTFECGVCVCVCALWLTSQRVPIYFGLSFSRRLKWMRHVQRWCATVGPKTSNDANDDDAMLSQLTISINSRCRFRNSPISYRFYLKNPENTYSTAHASWISLGIAWLMGDSKVGKKKSLAQRQSMNVGTTTSFQLHCSTNFRLLFAISITFFYLLCELEFLSSKSEDAINKWFVGVLCGQMTCAKWRCTFQSDRLQGNLIQAMIHAKEKQK